MNDLIKTVKLDRILKKYGITSDAKDFEDFYSNLFSSNTNKDLINEIEVTIYSSLSLPDAPTIYDYLILSLRKTDLIATFNWDPFLAQAYIRNQHIVQPPNIVFLHGNVLIGVCNNCKVKGFTLQSCTGCGNNLSPTQLLFPVKYKNYQDVFIQHEWDTLKKFLHNAYLLTIFGYSAPGNDVEARSLMKNAWKSNQKSQLTEINIINTDDEIKLESIWSEFFIRSHYSLAKDIFESYLLIHPRRSCEAFEQATLYNNPWNDNQFPRFKKLHDMYEWIQPLLKQERSICV